MNLVFEFPSRWRQFLQAWIPVRAVRRAATAVNRDPYLAARESETDGFRKISFTFAIIALCAKVARADGAVKQEEFLAFCQQFPMAGDDHARVHRLFVMACKERNDEVHYARQVAQLFPGRRALFDEIVARLCRVALCDGPATQAETQAVLRIAEALGSNPGMARSHLCGQQAQAANDPYAILGVTRKTPNDVIKKTYRDRIRILHPDRLRGAGYAPEHIAAADAELAAVNGAYAAIAHKRNLR